jgi:sarcosine oxidase subunit alpha
MKRVEVAIVGGGPAGLNAALAAAGGGAGVLVIDRQDLLGGQLIKQTHRFFGSRREQAGVRGIDIARDLSSKVLAESRIEVWLGATAVGAYPDGVLLVDRNGALELVLPARLIVAAGAAERPLAFANNDLPGVYGAGAVQTMMNVHGVLPGRRAVMVGAGNIGLIVSYQLLQAGVEVAAVLEAAPAVGGYLVHAAKLARSGVPVLTSHTLVAAYGERSVTGVRAARVGPDWRPVPGSEFDLECDLVCLAVGLSPLVEIAALAGCRLAYVSELGGYVPFHDQEMRSSVQTVFVCGDAAGVEEASSAMVEGRLAGLAAAASLRPLPGYSRLRDESLSDLARLRAGPTGDKIRAGMARMLRLAGQGGRQVG